MLGAFDRCEICANAENLLKNLKFKSEEELNIIRMYRRRHILQQFDERNKLLQNIESTRVTDVRGQPTRCLILTDAMTERKGK